MLLNHEKINFLHLPTPLEYLPTLSKELEIELYIKRDDLTGIGMGGNKLRKLEYFLYDAKAKGATTLLTMGGAQTNHGRLTAAVAAKYGMKCVILCIDEYPGEVSANILLDRLMGAEVVLKKSDGRNVATQYEELVAEVTKRYESNGEIVYPIPIGGSNELGILGYYECAMELTKQAEEKNLKNARIISTVGSMGTYMGLFCGLKNEKSPLSLTGVAILPFETDKETHIMRYFEKVKDFYNLPLTPTGSDFDVEVDYIREGYNKPNRVVREAIYKMARKEAIILDPCYTGKTFAAILDMVKEGKIKKGETIIFLHTGGHPGINTPFHRIEMEKELIDGVTIL
ncbi:MAG: D-cysteine desulfhydrase family protein [Anaerovorax sp.]|nr:D-cysteine desulfhydrase family protein [Anaerovorax sp.]